MNSDIRMQIRNFEVTAEDKSTSVLVGTDDELDMKFEKCGVLDGDNKGDHVRVAMALNLDDGPVDRIDVYAGRTGIYDALLMVQGAIELALRGWAVANDGPIE